MKLFYIRNVPIYMQYCSVTSAVTIVGKEYSYHCYIVSAAFSIIYQYIGYDMSTLSALHTHVFVCVCVCVCVCVLCVWTQRQ